MYNHCKGENKASHSDLTKVKMIWMFSNSQQGDWILSNVGAGRHAKWLLLEYLHTSDVMLKLEIFEVDESHGTVFNFLPIFI